MEFLVKLPRVSVRGEPEYLAFVAQRDEPHGLRDGFIVFAGRSPQAVGVAQAREPPGRPRAGGVKNVELANAIDGEYRAFVEAGVPGSRHRMRGMVVIEAHRGIGPQAEAGEELVAPE